MMVLQATWEQIGKEFTDDEKAALRSAVQGRVTCPPELAQEPARRPEGG